MSRVVAKIDMDNGSFPLAKDSLKTLAKTKLSGAHRALIDVIWMETYGWHDKNNNSQSKLKQRKTSAQIPYEVFIEETWMGKSSISKRINELVSWNIIIRDKNTSPYTYSFNVIVSKWDNNIFRNTRVIQPVNSSQDSKQLTGLSTSSSQDMKLEVNRIDNCYQVETLDTQEKVTPLNNIKESIKESSSSNAREEINKNISQVAKYYHNHYGKFMNSVQIESLKEWLNKGLSKELIISAMEVAIKENITRFSYLEGILSNWHSKGINNIDELEIRKAKDKLSEGGNGIERCRGDTKNQINPERRVSKFSHYYKKNNYTQHVPNT